jgi:hypothetical protein
MKKNCFFALLLSIVFFNSKQLLAQCDTIADRCLKHLPPYLSDGQNYRALVVGDEIAEFHGTFLGGSTYRIAACSGMEDGNLIFSIYDQERNLLYTNEKHKNAPFWDFKFNYSQDCIIETKLDKSKNLKSGCAVLLIGFKQP